VYKKAYEDIRKTFYPEKFNPQHWAQAAREAGMKYMVFTTKHHDGFCMFDSRYTDYKITDPGSRFSAHLKNNIVKEVFSAFREQGLGETGKYTHGGNTAMVGQKPMDTRHRYAIHCLHGQAASARCSDRR